MSNSSVGKKKESAAKKEELNSPVEVFDEILEQEVVPPVYDQAAFSVFEKNGLYHLVEFRFNTNTLVAGPGIILKKNPDKFDVEYDLNEEIDKLFE